MSAYLVPGFGAGYQSFTNQGVVNAGGMLWSYVAGSVNTPQPTYTDSTTAVQNSNPVVLDSAGRVPQELWITVATKFVLMDKNSNILGTWDNVNGLNNVSTTQSEWLISGLIPTYVSSTVFTVSGNQTSVFNVNRRVLFKVGTGTFYGYVVTTSFDGISTTTVTIVPDSTGMDNTLYEVDYGLLNPVNQSFPQNIVRQNNPINWCGTAAGTANALLLTPVVPCTAYLAGTSFAFKTGASTNSGATTAQVSALGTIALQLNGAACVGGELLANSWYEIMLTSSSVAQIFPLNAASITQVQNGTTQWIGTISGSNALTGTAFPPITAYSAGQKFTFKSGAAQNASGTTISINGLAAIPVQINGIACVGGEIQPNSFYEVLFDTASTCQLSSSSTSGRATGATGGGSDAAFYECDNTITTSWTIGQSAYISGVTVTIASPGVFTLANHGFVADSAIHFTTTGALPTGLAIDTPYYVISTGLASNSFQVATSIGGTAVNTSGSQSGVHSVGKIKNAITGSNTIVASGATVTVPASSVWTCV